MARKDANPGQDLRIAERRILVLDLRKTGASYRAIAQHLRAKGYDECSPATCHADVKAALRELSKKQTLKTEEYRALELERLDSMLLAIYPQVTKGHLGAIQTALQISIARARLIPEMEAPREISGKAILEIVYGEDGGDGRTES